MPISNADLKELKPAKFQVPADDTPTKILKDSSTKRSKKVSASDKTQEGNNNGKGAADKTSATRGRLLD